MIGFQSSFGMLLAICYALAMTSTALAVLLGCSVEDPKLGQEMLPILFVPQMLFAGFFVTPDLIPVWVSKDLVLLVLLPCKSETNPLHFVYGWSNLFFVSRMLYSFSFDGPSTYARSPTLFAYRLSRSLVIAVPVKRP